MGNEEKGCKEKASSVVKKLVQEITVQSEGVAEEVTDKLTNYLVVVPSKASNPKETVPPGIEPWPPYFDDLRSNLWKIRDFLSHISEVLNMTEL